MTIERLQDAPRAHAVSYLATAKSIFLRAIRQHRPRRAFARQCGVLLCALMLCSGVPVAQAQSQYLAAQGVLVVRNDPGGLVGTRASEITDLGARGIRVELRGEVCLSSCTMYLGLAKTCVSRTTTFGFHGPSYYGAKLNAQDFEYWSQVIASHYPPRLQSWFLSTARYKINDYYRVKGVELIRMGVRECQNA